jgi:uncharacterized protein YjdB
MRQIVLCFGAFVMACSGYDPAAPADSSAVASVTIEPPTVPLNVGSALRVKVIVRNAVGQELVDRPIVFASSNEQVLIVDNTGLMRALAEGEATLFATSGGKTGQTTISVVPDGPCYGCWDYSTTP